MKQFLLPFLVLLAACGAEEPMHHKLPLDDLRGRWVVVNYWAEWCKPCIQEIPELNELAMNHQEVEVFGINYDGITGEELNTQAEALGIRFNLLQEDPAAQLGLPRPVVLPTTLVLNPQGELTQTLLGPQTLESLTAATQH
jgi:thiol-disulfide isomerase/thioredoxin